MTCTAKKAREDKILLLLTMMLSSQQPIPQSIRQCWNFMRLLNSFKPHFPTLLARDDTDIATYNLFLFTSWKTLSWKNTDNNHNLHKQRLCSKVERLPTKDCKGLYHLNKYDMLCISAEEKCSER